MIIIDEQSKEPIYRQIIEQVRHYVAIGTLAVGDELPSLRQLAVNLNVHLNTVVLAYRELERQGIIRLRQGSRATIIPIDRTTLMVQSQVATQIRTQLVRVRTEAILAGMSLDDLRAIATSVFHDAATDVARGK